MGRCSKIFKAFRHNGLEGHNNSFGGPSTSENARLEKENEDIDRIALSFSKENQNKKIDKKTQLEEDERLARALQEGLNVESYFLYGNGNSYQGNIQFPAVVRICTGCNAEIVHGGTLNCLNAFWHPECLRCHACKLQITDHKISMSGNFAYHMSCFKKCDVCQHHVPINPAGHFDYLEHPYWLQKYCPSHKCDNTHWCCSCERMEPQDAGYIALKDGRKLCLECLDSAIMDTDQCEPLYQDIQAFYENLNMKVEQYVPLLLVDRPALNEAGKGEENGHMRETRGLCLYKKKMILRRPSFGAENLAMGTITGYEVTAIHIMHGLPRLLTGSILAHEMMHAWIRLRGFQTLGQDVEEGICQVLAHMWLDSQLSGNSASWSSSASREGPSSQLERKLGEFFKYLIESDASPVSGEGFRAGRQAVRDFGLESTIEHIRLTGRFPY